MFMTRAIICCFFSCSFKEPSLKVGDVTYRMFDRVAVKIRVDKSSTENKFLSFSLVSKKVNKQTRKQTNKQTKDDHDFTYYVAHVLKSSSG